MNIVLKRSMVFVAVAMFIALAFSSAMAQSPQLAEQDSSLEAEISVFQPDGSIQTHTIKLSEEIVDEIKQRLIEDQGENTLGILAEYDLISDEMGACDWESAMQTRAENLGLNVFENKLRIGVPALFRLFNKVSVVNIGGGSTRIGITPALRLIELFTRLNLNRIDLIDTSWGLMSVVNTKGVFSQHTVIGPSYTAMVGFVGVAFKIPFLLNVFDGYAIASMTIGVGMHIKDRGIQIGQ